MSISPTANVPSLATALADTEPTNKAGEEYEEKELQNPLSPVHAKIVFPNGNTLEWSYFTGTSFKVQAPSKEALDNSKKSYARQE